MTTRKLLALLLFAAAAAAETPPPDRAYRLQWRDLDRVARTRTIDLTLPSGIRLRGVVVSVEAEELVMDVARTSNRRAYPKGRATVPRPEVQRFRLIEKKGHTWRAVGAAIGGTIGTAIAIPMAMYLHNEGGSAAGAATLAVAIPAGLGYLVGWSSDRKVMDIVVEP
jgi:hypothetical protein